MAITFKQKEKEITEYLEKFEKIEFTIYEDGVTIRDHVAMEITPVNIKRFKHYKNYTSRRGFNKHLRKFVEFLESLGFKEGE